MLTVGVYPEAPLLTVVVAAALAAPCPVPDSGPFRVSADGAAHVVSADARAACWWIVDDTGDARIGGRWERARRDPVAFVALADGRLVAVLREENGGLRLGVRAERDGERRLDVPVAAPPAWFVAHPSAPLVALGWPDGEARLVDVDTGGWVEARTSTLPAWVSGGGCCGR